MIALVTTHDARGHDKDLGILSRALDACGAEWEIVDWDDQHVDWSRFSIAVLRSTWDYYERLEQYLESGAYDRIPGGPVDPETDPSTYNGARWRLARETYWRDPNVAPATSSAEYQRALAFYQHSAVTDAFRWSWRDAQLQQDVYIQTIRSANRSYQRAVNVLGLVAVNHLASLVDAYVSVRIRRYGGVRMGRYSLDGVHVGYAPPEPGMAGTNAGWQAGLRFSTH